MGFFRFKQLRFEATYFRGAAAAHPFGFGESFDKDEDGGGVDFVIGCEGVLESFVFGRGFAGKE